MGKKGVDGVYDADRDQPEGDEFDRLTYDEASQRGLKVVDATGFALCMENKPADGRLRPLDARATIVAPCGVRRSARW